MSHSSRLPLLLLVTLAITAQFCPCPADAAAAGDAGHAVHTAATPEPMADCHGDETRDDCVMSAADAPDLSPKPDQRNADEPGALPWDPLTAALRDTHTCRASPPPLNTESLPNDSPVVRADRLLD